MSSQSVAFDRAAEYYDESRGFPPGVESPVTAMMAQVGNFDSHSRVLEIGVGTGRIGLPLAAHVGVYCGIDLSIPMMQRLHAKQTGEPVFLAQADATRLPFPDGRFDGVVSVHVFHLIPTWTQALAEVGRVLRPGAVLLNCWNAWDQGDTRIDKMWAAWENAMPTEHRPTVGADVREDPDFIQKQGWQPQGDLQTHTYATIFNPSQQLDFMRRRMSSRHWRLSDEEHAAALAAVEAVIAEQFDDPTESFERPGHFHIQAFLPPESMSYSP